MFTLFTTTFSIAALEGWLIALVPSLTAVAAIVVALCNIIKNIKNLHNDYNSLKTSVDDKTELTEVKAEMQSIMKQNNILREELEQVVCSLNKVNYNGKKRGD